MQTTFILRLLSAEREVLAWTRLVGESRGDGKLWPVQHFVAEGDRTGTAVALNVHWVDVNVHLTLPLEGTVPVQEGVVVTLALRNPLLTISSEELPLPPVTVRRPVEIGIGSAHA